MARRILGTPAEAPETLSEPPGHFACPFPLGTPCELWSNTRDTFPLPGYRMNSPVRQQFLDLTWDGADLDAAAQFWLRLYEQGKTWRIVSRVPKHALEIRLSGFPRHIGDSLLEELQRRATVSDLSNLAVVLAAPDTLVLRSDAQSGTSPIAGMGLFLLEGSLFDGLLVEIRFGIAGGEGLAFLSKAANNSLVLIGELKHNKLRVKTLWRSPLPAEEDEWFWQFPMEEEHDLLAGFWQYRATGVVTTPLAKAMFCGYERMQWRTWTVEQLLDVPFGRPRLPGLLIRFLVFAVLLTFIGIRIVAAINNAARDPVWLALPVVGGTVVGYFGLRFLYAEYELLFGLYPYYRDSYGKERDVPVQYVALTSDEATKFRDPAVEMYTADLHAVGFAHIGDLAPVPTDVVSICRVFRSPDKKTYLTLICLSAYHYEPEGQRCIWPAIVSFYAESLFVGGGRAESLCGLSHGYKRRPTGPDTLYRVFPETNDPVELFHQHTAAAQVFADDLGLSPQPHETVLQLARRWEESHKEEREYRSKHSYSWWDHLRWYLQWPRKEQRG